MTHTYSKPIYRIIFCVSVIALLSSFAFSQKRVTVKHATLTLSTTRSVAVRLKPTTPDKRYPVAVLILPGLIQADSYHCCDDSGNCSDAVDLLTQCLNSFKVHCYETDNQSVCEPEG